MLLWAACVPTFFLFACDKTSLCEEQLEFEEQKCGIVLKDPNVSCKDPALACHYKCIAGATCEERRQLYFEDDMPSYERWRCFLTCREGVACDGNEADPAIRQCDGFIECADGSDERGCVYHTCTDGQNVSADAVCDGYDHCADSSDEESCGGIL